MDVIGFKSAKCRNCYRCVRNCVLKAISVQNSQAYIMDNRCILCGRCLDVCPQNAKTLISDLDRVKQFLHKGYQVIISLAPSHAAFFTSHTPGQTVQALYELGFHAIYETAQGAALVTAQYRELMKENKMKYIISSCCPSINDLIEIYYPSLCEYLAPVVSPMIAHAKQLKVQYGKEVKIVFIGPCIAKKREAEIDPRTKGVVDAVLNFHELEDWLKEEKIVPSQLQEAKFSGKSPGIHRFYPEEGGILTTFSTEDISSKYRRLSVSGLENCMDLFSSLMRNELEPCFLEVNACNGGCINGSALSSYQKRFSGMLSFQRYAASDQDKTQVEEKEDSFHDISFMRRTFSDRSPKIQEPSEEDILRILHLLGKHSKQDLLNCGACGYNSCREKAVAVLEGKAELTMCLPYMQERAQSMANAVLDHTPNIILILDSKGHLLEYSSSAEEFFAPLGILSHGVSFDSFVDIEPFLQVLKTNKPIYDQKVTYPALNRITLQKIIPIEPQNCVLIILDDITKEEENRKKVQTIRLDALEMAQKVIDRQMFVAQEIAGLLGETTAETKVTLNRLRDMISQDDTTSKNQEEIL